MHHIVLFIWETFGMGYKPIPASYTQQKTTLNEILFLKEQFLTGI
jgi:hypothetical protein